MYDFNFTPVFAGMDHLWLGAWLTIRLSGMAMIIGLVVSVICAGAKTSGIRPLRWVVDAYVEVIRNTPFLVQIFFFYFGLPSLGLRLDPNQAALLALVVNFGAYGTEIIRAGIESIDHGQIEAGRADIPARHHEARIADGLSVSDQSVHLSDADLKCGVGDFGQRSGGGGQRSAIANLRQFRGLSGGHRDLSRDVYRVFDAVRPDRAGGLQISS